MNEKKGKKYLGIDWGKSDVGVALADKETRLAFAYTTLKNNEYLLENLLKIIHQEYIDTAIIGIPSYVNKKEVVYEGEKLGALLEKEAKILVFYQNEMFTTKLAETYLIEKGIKEIKKYDDQEAARIILQEWLDKKTQSEKRKM